MWGTVGEAGKQNRPFTAVVRNYSRIPINFLKNSSVSRFMGVRITVLIVMDYGHRIEVVRSSPLHREMFVLQQLDMKSIVDVDGENCVRKSRYSCSANYFMPC